MNTELEAFLKRVNLDIVSYETTRTLKLADIEYAQKDGASIGESSENVALVTEAVIVYYNTCDQEMIQTQKRNLVINF